MITLHGRFRRTMTSLALSLGLTALPAGARAAEPEPGGAAPADRKFVVDPVADLTYTAAMTGAAVLTSVILGTGEIAPQHATPGSQSKILSIDRVAVDQTIDPNAGRNSTIGLGAAMAFAALDPILTGTREGWKSGAVDALMYAESLATTAFVTDVTKIAVRRPRPIDYKNPPTDSTDAVLSYFSGHVSMTAAAVSTATYLSFVRSPNTARPWVTLGVGTALTGFVAYERVRSGKHFPTDVLAGSMAGAAIGVLVPHMHRQRHEGSSSLWIAAAPTPGGGTVVVSKLF